jgi:alpha-beta hydrolase superfamily lysophospholipase
MTDDAPDFLTAERRSLTAEDGRRILVDIWAPSQPKALIHVFHGLGEHPARYERFANYCITQQIAVGVHNHRGHGENCPVEELGHYADEEGWNKLISDAALVQDELIRQVPGVPVILFGHSMGSYIAQSFLMRGQDSVSALALSATSFNSRAQLRVGHWLAAFECIRGGKRNKSALLNKMGFGEFNKPFKPNRTEFDWLSRDENEVDKYIADPLSGVDSSSRLWFDLTGGLLEVSSLAALRRIRADLPILITGGSDDPVGGRKGLTRLAQKFEETGHTNTTLKIYEGGRHEMLNETNRDDFSRDLTQWMAGAVLERSATGMSYSDSSDSEA